MQTTRRGFFGIVGGAIAAAVVAPRVVEATPVAITHTQFGMGFEWTEYVIDKPEAGFGTLFDGSDFKPIKVSRKRRKSRRRK